MDLDDRFWSKVEKTETCWLWIACLNRDGYGLFGFERKVWRAHRLVYTKLVSPIPSGLEIDHLCRARACVNPAHLEAVKHHENVRRGELKNVKGGKLFCEKGHAFTPENTYLNTHAGQLRRRCKLCKSNYQKKRNASRGKTI